MEENVQAQEGQRGVRGGCPITTLGGAHLTLLGNHSQQFLSTYPEGRCYHYQEIEVQRA